MSSAGQVAGRLLCNGAWRGGTLHWRAGRITRLEFDPRLDNDPNANYIVPGFIDMHVHGFGGCEPSTDLKGMAQALASQGTTAFQPTLFPEQPARMRKTAAKVWGQVANLQANCASVIGLHAEGPFVNPLKAGALPAEDLALPSVQALSELLGSSAGDANGLRTLTVAPELPGAADLTAECLRRGLRVSSGHSVATLKEAQAASRAGARGITHLYNAMSGVHHREAGLAHWALLDEAAHVECIGDLVHSTEAAVQLALRACGTERLCLVSDALLGAGTGCDVFHVHGREHHVREGAAWLEVPDTSNQEDCESSESEPSTRWALGGAVLSQLEMVRKLVNTGVMTLSEAATCASTAPAAALDLSAERGTLEVGKRADLLALSPELNLQSVWLAGVALAH